MSVRCEHSDTKFSLHQYLPLISTLIYANCCGIHVNCCEILVNCCGIFEISQNYEMTPEKRVFSLVSAFSGLIDYDH